MSTNHLCRLSGVKRASYYSWLSVQCSKHLTQHQALDNVLKPLIKDAYNEYRGRAVAPRIKAWLLKFHAQIASRRRIYRLLNEFGLKIKQTQKFRNKNVSNINDTRIAKK